MCKVLNSTAIASGYAGRDPQEGTSDGSFFSKFSFIYNDIYNNIYNDIYNEKEWKRLGILWCW